MTHRARIALSIAADHPAFAGHFPGQPIVPGVVLLDACLRAIDGARGGAAAHAPLGIASAKFLSVVGPGEPLRLDCDGDARLQLALYAGAPGHERLAMRATLTLPDPATTDAR